MMMGKIMTTMLKSKTFECPSCKKVLMENNKKQFFDEDIIIKSKLIFLNEDGKVLCKCTCKKIVALPLDFQKSIKTISLKKIIDL